MPSECWARPARRQQGIPVGRIRDGAVLRGRSAPRAEAVDSVDEVLFMVTRQQLEVEPLTTRPEWAWHAYAVEYGLRLRLTGQRVGVMHLPITHNTLRANMTGLDVAHRALCSSYPQFMPLRTTMGTVEHELRRTERVSRQLQHVMRSVRGYAGRARARLLTGERLPRRDWRTQIDSLALSTVNPPLLVVNLDNETPRLVDDDSWVTLPRPSGPISYTARDLHGVMRALDEWGGVATMLLTNLSQSDVAALRSRLRAVESTVGFHHSIGRWAVVGPVDVRHRPRSIGRRACLISAVGAPNR